MILKKILTPVKVQEHIYTLKSEKHKAVRVLILPDIFSPNRRPKKVQKVRQNRVNKKKLIELFIYIAIVVIGVILLFTSNDEDKAIFKNLSGQGGASYAVISDYQ